MDMPQCRSGWGMCVCVYECSCARAQWVLMTDTQVCLCLSVPLVVTITTPSPNLLQVIFCSSEWQGKHSYPNWVQNQKDLDSSQSLHSCVVTILYSYCVLLIHAPMHTSIYVGAWQVSSVTTVCVHACTHMYVDNYNNVSIYTSYIS